jgi:hypothetical protein
MAMDHGKWMATLAAKLLESVPEAKTNGLDETYVRAVVEETIQHGQHVAVVPGTLEGKALDGLLCASEWRYGLVARSSPYQDMGRPAPAGGVLVIELLLGRPGCGAAAVLIAHARDIAKARNLKYLALQPADSCQEGVSTQRTCKYCSTEGSLLEYYKQYGFVGVPYVLPTMHDLFPCQGAGCDYCQKNTQVCMTMVALVDAEGPLKGSLDVDWASCATEKGLVCNDRRPRPCPASGQKIARRAGAQHRNDPPQSQDQPQHRFTRSSLVQGHTFRDRRPWGHPHTHTQNPTPHLQPLARRADEPRGSDRNGSPPTPTPTPWTRSGLPRRTPSSGTADMRATPGAGFSSDRH